MLHAKTVLSGNKGGSQKLRIIRCCSDHKNHQEQLRNPESFVKPQEKHNKLWMEDQIDMLKQGSIQNSS